MMFGHSMGWFGYFTMALFWLAVIVAVLYFIRQNDWWTPKKQEGKHQEDKALAILRERYAKGEVNKEKFDERRRVLQ
jgi:putative membrane protein